MVSEGGIEVEFHDAQGTSIRLCVRQTTPLRDLQKILVAWLGLSFPLHSATLTSPDGTVSDTFNDTPFANAQNGDMYAVAGELSSDMYFFDKLFKFDH